MSEDKLFIISVDIYATLVSISKKDIEAVIVCNKILM